MEKSYLLYLCKSVAKITLFIQKRGRKPFSQVLHSFPNMISAFYQTVCFCLIFGGKFWFWQILNFWFYLLNIIYVRVTVQSHDNTCDLNQPSNEIDLDMGTSDFFSFGLKLIILDLMSKKKIAIDLQGELWSAMF